MGLMLAFTFVELATPSNIHHLYMLTMSTLVLMLSLLFKGSRLIAATSVLACLVSVWAVTLSLTIGLSPMMMVLPFFDIGLGLIVGRTTAERQIAEALRLA